MKLLVALLHGAAASQLIFDSFAPATAGSFGTPVTREQSLGVQFRSVDFCGASSSLEYVNFTVSTENIDNSATWLDVALCPSKDGLPNCDSTVAPQRYPITTIAKRIQYSWLPTKPIALQSDTRYWFVLSSNAELVNHAVIWLDGLKRFTSANDPKKDVVTGFTTSEGGAWVADAARENRTVSSMQVVIKD
ncbi:Aste57867_11483 [Aphanomyces stellatus]|uniref:Aste57867_11483 protein n=1 Tax=Aphanomyces stellatus TaxID=120398 RepID=A0A485KTF2_9STRA|nr:hypothetical protein As57867_011440 [Aphanomyces stellatus]VFT88344.1 Aste57867_11483 [Aphanomyces stellatus]